MAVIAESPSGEGEVRNSEELPFSLCFRAAEVRLLTSKMGRVPKPNPVVQQRVPYYPKTIGRSTAG